MAKGQDFGYIYRTIASHVHALCILQAITALCVTGVPTRVLPILQRRQGSCRRAQPLPLGLQLLCSFRLSASRHTHETQHMVGDTSWQPQQKIE
jgi:hypothetical protein